MKTKIAYCIPLFYKIISITLLVSLLFSCEKETAYFISKNKDEPVTIQSKHTYFLSTELSNSYRNDLISRSNKPYTTYDDMIKDGWKIIDIPNKRKTYSKNKIKDDSPSYPIIAGAETLLNIDRLTAIIKEKNKRSIGYGRKRIPPIGIAYNKYTQTGTMPNNGNLFKNYPSYSSIPKTSIRTYEPVITKITPPILENESYFKTTILENNFVRNVRHRKRFLKKQGFSYSKINTQGWSVGGNLSVSVLPGATGGNSPGGSITGSYSSSTTTTNQQNESISSFDEISVDYPIPANSYGDVITIIKIYKTKYRMVITRKLDGYAIINYKQPVCLDLSQNLCERVRWNFLITNQDLDLGGSKKGMIKEVVEFFAYTTETVTKYFENPNVTIKPN